MEALCLGRMRMNRSYSELIELPTFAERLAYLQCDQIVSEQTLSGHRWMCQNFYRSKEWKEVRDRIITRDLGRDLAVEGYDIFGKIVIHHLNPLTIEDYKNVSYKLMDPENLITTTPMTHNAIHYGGDDVLTYGQMIIRTPDDTTLWKH